MCDDRTAADNARWLASRRQFGVAAGAAGVMAVLPSPVDAATVTGRNVEIRTPDGVCDAFFVAPATGRHPAVLVWPDIMGLRSAFERMGTRLAESGYAVLVVNQFYRNTRAPFAKGDLDAARKTAFGWRATQTPETTVSDGNAFVDWLDKQRQVDTRRGMASTGYCMGGPMVMRVAAARPDRIRAGASFHGAGVATDRPDSPHLLVPKMRAQFLFAVAENDDTKDPQEKELVRAAFAAAKLPAEVEVYAGTLHGWCPPDSAVYNEAQAEKAWARQLALFQRAL